MGVCVCEKFDHFSSCIDKFPGGMWRGEKIFHGSSRGAREGRFIVQINMRENVHCAGDLCSISGSG